MFPGSQSSDVLEKNRAFKTLQGYWVQPASDPENTGSRPLAFLSGEGKNAWSFRFTSTPPRRMHDVVNRDGCTFHINYLDLQDPYAPSWRGVNAKGFLFLF